MEGREGGSRASPGRKEKYEKGLFCLRNSRDGETYWFIRFMGPDGKRHKERAGTRKQDAKALLEKRRVEVRDGTWKDRREVERDTLTFDRFADRFESEYASQCRSDYYTQMLKPLRAHFGHRLLRSVTAADLDAYRQHCIETDQVGASTTRKRLTVLGTMFKRARRWGLVEVNPAADMDKPSEPAPKTRYLSRDEWEGLKIASEPWLRPILTLAVATGMRLKEAVGLTWENVDRDNGLLYVSEDTKTGKPRAVPLTETVRQVLEAQVRHVRSSYVFLDANGQPYTSVRQRNIVSQRTRAAAKAAKLDGVTFHTLRHTAGSWMAQAGYSEVYIAEVLGHATTATTKRYMHLTPGHLRAPVQAIDAVLRGAVGPHPAHNSESANRPDPAAATTP